MPVRDQNPFELGEAGVVIPASIWEFLPVGRFSSWLQFSVPLVPVWGSTVSHLIILTRHSVVDAFGSSLPPSLTHISEASIMCTSLTSCQPGFCSD